MISSLTDLANDALNAINAGNITSIDSTDRLSKICLRYMDLAFEQPLSKGKFTSCTTRKVLALSDADPIYGYQYCYYLPARAPNNDGYIKALKLQSEADFDLENGLLSTDDSAAILIYIYRPFNLGLFPQVILDCVAMKLATLICMEVKPDTERLLLAQTRYKAALRDARSFNRTERHGLRMRPQAWSDVGGSNVYGQRVE